MTKRIIEVRYQDRSLRTFEVYVFDGTPLVDVKIGSGRISFGTIDKFIKDYGLRETIALMVQREIWKRGLTKLQVNTLLKSWRSRMSREGLENVKELTI